MSKEILVIGSLNMDMITEMRELPVKGETILGDKLSYVPGGKGANQACAVGSLGNNVTMLGCVGNDEFGKIQKNILSEKGVEISRLKESGDENTGIAIIYVDVKGDNSIVVIQGANKECDVAYLKENDESFKKCDFVLLQMEIPHDAIYYAINRAKELGKTVILNPAPAPEGIPEEILKKIDYITPNETELYRLAGGEGENINDIEMAAQRLLDKGVKNVIVTLGKRGALLVNEEKKQLYPAEVVEAVDTTAAGDCFNGAFVVGLAEGKEEEAISFANLASSITVTRKGALNSIPTRDEVNIRKRKM